MDINSQVTWKKNLTDLHRGHTCLLCHNREEQISAATAFLEIGLERNERCVYLTDPRSMETVREAFRKNGIDIEKEAGRGRLRLVTDRAYLTSDGSFDPGVMVNFLLNSVGEALRDGFTALRATGDVFWEIGSKTNPDVLLVYERMLDKVFTGKPLVGLCQYRMSDFSAHFIRNAMYTHPVALLDGKMRKTNPYYDPSKLFAEADALHQGQPLDMLFLNLKRSFV